MINLMSQEEIARIPVMILPKHHDRPDTDCPRCEAYRPEPQLSGNSQVDPELYLPAPLPVDLSIYYNGVSTVNGPFGYGRTISPNQMAQASGSPMLVTLSRDNGALVSYSYNGSSYVPQTPGCLNSLTQNGTYWQETTLDGMVSAWPYNTTGRQQ